MTTEVRQRMAISTILRELILALVDAAKVGDLAGHLAAWWATVGDDRMPFRQVRLKN